MLSTEDSNYPFVYTIYWRKHKSTIYRREHVNWLKNSHTCPVYFWFFDLHALRQLCNIPSCSLLVQCESNLCTTAWPTMTFFNYIKLHIHLHHMSDIKHCGFHKVGYFDVVLSVNLKIVKWKPILTNNITKCQKTDMSDEEISIILDSNLWWNCM